MNFRDYSFKSALFLLILAVGTIGISAQKGPRQEKLLNGVKLLMWNVPTADKITVKVRVHSGAAFDPQQKEGVMRVLADNIFPNEGAREFFSEELGGSLDVTFNYDYIQVTATSSPDKILEVLETLAAAISNPQIDKETTIKLRTALAEKVKTLEQDPAYAADMLAANRLFGTFPYGRPMTGSSASVQKIDFADLIQARQRFLTADNATITITGNYNADRALRAVKRYFGAWLKSDRKTPSTFRAPDDPNTEALTPGPLSLGNTEVRYALRGFARGDKDFPASEIFMNIARKRWLASKPAGLKIENMTARQDVHILPGNLMFGLTLPLQPLGEAGGSKLNTGLIPANITEDEFARAKAEVLAEYNSRDLQEKWLDVDTYAGPTVADEAAAYQTATIADVRRVAEKLAKNPVVTIYHVTPAEKVAAR